MADPENPSKQGESGTERSRFSARWPLGTLMKNLFIMKLVIKEFGLIFN